MGQRLNLEIKTNDKTLANCYYHWSGYTSSALELTKIILDNLSDKELTQDYAVELLKLTGAGNSDRNDGLIGITDKDIEDTRYWAEASVFINLESRKVKLDIFFVLDVRELDENTEVKFVNNFKFEPTFEEFEEVYYNIMKMAEGREYHFKYGNDIYGLIE